MNNLVLFEVTSTVETALKKLTKADIAVYRLKKHGSRLRFGVESEYYEKVFAIFAHPCYNVSVVKYSRKERLKIFAKTRFGLIAGAVLFVAAAVLSGQTVMRIKVTGNGSYLSDSVLSIASECGAREFSFCRSLDAPLLQAKVMALPSVNFCSVQRAGAYLIIDVRTEEEHTAKADNRPLRSTVTGEVYKIVAVCGTAERAVGDKVAAGDVLIGAYELTENGDKNSCLAVGFAEIKVKATVSLYYNEESEENAQTALKAAALYSDRILESAYKVTPCESGVRYDVDFTYVKTVAVNMQ